MGDRSEGRFGCNRSRIHVHDAEPGFGRSRRRKPRLSLKRLLPAPLTPLRPPVEAAAEEVALSKKLPPEAPALTVDKGDTTWMLVSTVLVLLMIIPGLALFYGGLVRSKNMISLLMQVLIVTAIGMVAWVGWGYSMAFTDGGEAQHVRRRLLESSAWRASIPRRWSKPSRSASPSPRSSSSPSR